MPTLAPNHNQPRPKVKQHAQQSRGTSASRGYGYKWQQARAVHLAHEPLCRHCERRGITTPANEVDHIIPHKGDQSLFWDQDNWQSLCKPCHSRKTAREDGGFGQQGKASAACDGSGMPIDASHPWAGN